MEEDDKYLELLDAVDFYTFEQEFFKESGDIDLQIEAELNLLLAQQDLTDYVQDTFDEEGLDFDDQTYFDFLDFYDLEDSWLEDLFYADEYYDDDDTYD